MDLQSVIMSGNSVAAGHGRDTHEKCHSAVIVTSQTHSLGTVDNGCDEIQHAFATVTGPPRFGMFVWSRCLWTKRKVHSGGYLELWFGEEIPLRVNWIRREISHEA